MIEPVELQDFFVAFFAGAMVIMCGALYAGLFAWSRVRRKQGLMPLAYTAYCGLALAVLALANATHLRGFWAYLVSILLVGYLLAPHGIWHLCVATHTGGDGDTKDVSQSGGPAAG